MTHSRDGLGYRKYSTLTTELTEQPERTPVCRTVRLTGYKQIESHWISLRKLQKKYTAIKRNWVHEHFRNDPCVQLVVRFVDNEW